MELNEKSQDKNCNTTNNLKTAVQENEENLVNGDENLKLPDKVVNNGLETQEPLPNDQKEKENKNRWSPEAVKILVMNRLHLEKQFRQSQPWELEDLWNTIMNILLTNGYDFTIYDMINQWDILYNMYDEILHSLPHPDCAQHVKWEYFQPIHEIYSKSDDNGRNTPPFVSFDGYVTQKPTNETEERHYDIIHTNALVHNEHDSEIPTSNHTISSTTNSSRNSTLSRRDQVNSSSTLDVITVMDVHSEIVPQMVPVVLTSLNTPEIVPCDLNSASDILPATDVNTISDAITPSKWSEPSTISILNEATNQNNSPFNWNVNADAITSQSVLISPSSAGHSGTSGDNDSTCCDDCVCNCDDGCECGGCGDSDCGGCGDCNLM